MAGELEEFEQTEWELVDDWEIPCKLSACPCKLLRAMRCDTPSSSLSAYMKSELAKIYGKKEGMHVK